MALRPATCLTICAALPIYRLIDHVDSVKLAAAIIRFQLPVHASGACYAMPVSSNVSPEA